jgi:hypothetical protein
MSNWAPRHMLLGAHNIGGNCLAPKQLPRHAWFQSQPSTLNPQHQQPATSKMPNTRANERNAATAEPRDDGGEGRNAAAPAKRGRGATAPAKRGRGRPPKQAAELAAPEKGGTRCIVHLFCPSHLAHMYLHIYRKSSVQRLADDAAMEGIDPTKKTR